MDTRVPGCANYCQTLPSTPSHGQSSNLTILTGIDFIGTTLLSYNFGHEIIFNFHKKLIKKIRFCEICLI